MFDTLELSVYAISVEKRIAFEMSRTESQKAESNYKKFDASARVCNNEACATLMLASNVNVDFANRSLVANSRVNVYTVEKVTNAVSYAANAALLNQYTFHILKTAIALHAANLKLTRDDAKNVSTNLRVKLIAKERKQYMNILPKAIADSTVNSQYASSLDALCTLNVLTESQNNSFTLNTENAIAKILIEKVTA